MKYNQLLQLWARDLVALKMKVAKNLQEILILKKFATTK